MLWVPWLSLLVFFLIMILFTIYGIKRGWVYALTFSTTLWLVTLSFIGINYAIYKYLWKAFSPLILESKSDLNINLDNLSQFYKLQIIIFTTGVESILIYPLTFLIMLLVNKFIKKYFGHKVKSISNNEKEIISRRNIKASRIIGGTVLGTTTFFSASLIASALNTIFTPYRKTNFGNSMNDMLGQIYSLGLAKNTESAQIISDFINKKLDSKMAEAMRELTNFQGSETTQDNILPSISQLNYLSSRKDDFSELFENANATIGVFSSVIHTNENTLDPLAFDREIAIAQKDGNNNIVGYHKNASNYVNDLDAFQSFLAKNNLNIDFDNSIIDFLLRRINEKMLPFQATIFYKEYQALLKKTREYNDILKERENQNVKLKLEMSNLKDIRTEIVNNILKIVGSGASLKVDPFREGAKTIDPSSIDRSLPGTGTFKIEVDKENTFKVELDRINQAREASERDYGSYHNSIFIPKQNEVNQAKNEVNNATATLNGLKLRLKEAKSKKELLVIDIRRLRAEVTTIDSNIGATQVEISSELEAIDNKIVELEAEIKQLNLSKTSKAREIEQKEIASQNETNLINRLNFEIENQEKIVNNSKTLLEIVEGEFKPISTENNRLQEIMLDTTAKYQKAQQSYETQRTIVNNLIQSYSDLIAELNNKNETIFKLKKSINVLEKEDNNLLWDRSSKGPANEDAFPLNDDGSIYYINQAIKFAKDRTNQKKDISDQKIIKYNELKAKLTNDYRKWLKGV